MRLPVRSRRSGTRSPVPGCRGRNALHRMEHLVHALRSDPRQLSQRRLHLDKTRAWVGRPSPCRIGRSQTFRGGGPEDDSLARGIRSVELSRPAQAAFFAYQFLIAWATRNCAATILRPSCAVMAREGCRPCSGISQSPIPVLGDQPGLLQGRSSIPAKGRAELRLSGLAKGAYQLAVFKLATEPTISSRPIGTWDRPPSSPESKWRACVWPVPERQRLSQGWRSVVMVSSSVPLR